MKPAEIENLIAVKSQLAEKYRRKAIYSGSKSKRQQSEVRARSYIRQADALRRLQGTA